MSEVLLTSAIGLVVVIMGTSVFIEAMQSTTSMLTAQMLRTEWARIASLINADIAESCSSSGTSSALTLRLASGTSGTCTTNNPTVTYQLSGTTLTRNGPAVNRDGTLNLSSTAAAATIATNAAGFDASCSTSFNGCFALSLSESGRSYSGSGNQQSGARTRVRSYDP